MNPIDRNTFAAMVSGEFGAGQEWDRMQNPALAAALDREAAMQQEAAHRLGPSDMLGLMGGGEVSVDPVPSPVWSDGTDPGYGMMGSGQYKTPIGIPNNWQAQEAEAKRRPAITTRMNQISESGDANANVHYSQYPPEAVQAILPDLAQDWGWANEVKGRPDIRRFGGPGGEPPSWWTGWR